ncbi:unnamed protein product [Soboliphyme baturini]|uniref:Endo/exonuclease/phosphatase domain-containing protein n=1 Tax=Soboliphyme baturini TaxID=241478 RepID=A0A183J0J6_9BILA|nr:unnamed protein product [Soboliphyme baturini]
MVPARHSWIFSSKHHGTGILNLCWWKLFYSGVDVTIRAQAGVGVLVSLNGSLSPECWDGKYEFFLGEMECALYEVPTPEPLIVLGDLNAHAGVDSEKWNGVIGKNGPRDLENQVMEGAKEKEEEVVIAVEEIIYNRKNKGANDVKEKIDMFPEDKLMFFVTGQ